MIPQLADEQRYVAATLGQRALEDRFLDSRHRLAEETSAGQTADPIAHRVDIGDTVLGATALSALVFAVISAETAGFASPGVIALLCVSAAACVSFCWHENRVAHPLLDLHYLPVPQFLTANVVAFCACFATFAVFFFTALYLAELTFRASGSGYLAD